MISIIIINSVSVVSAQSDIIKPFSFSNNGFDIQKARLSQEIIVSKPLDNELTRIEDEIKREKEERERIVQRARKIAEYLSKRGAPLAKYAENIVIAGEKYGVEPELVAAIAVIESGGGKINFRPFNAWGWGRQSFRNWEDAIDRYTQGLANGYVARGLDTPQKIAPIYCPPNRYNWARNVSNVMNGMKA